MYCYFYSSRKELSMPKKETGSNILCRREPRAVSTNIKELLVSLSIIIIPQKFFYGNLPLGFLRG